MTAPDLTPEFLALPLGPNGLPDLLIITKSFAQAHLHGVVRAFIVQSDPKSKGYWSERFNADGDDAVKWARLFAIERARQHFFSQRTFPGQLDAKPLEFEPFQDWDALSVRRAMGCYPHLQFALGSAESVSAIQFINEHDKAYNVMVTPQSFVAS